VGRALQLRWQFGHLQYSGWTLCSPARLLDQSETMARSPLPAALSATSPSTALSVAPYWRASIGDAGFIIGDV
jgi:hypothetical protein